MTLMGPLLVQLTSISGNWRPLGQKKARNAGFSQLPRWSERRVAEFLATESGFVHQAALGYGKNRHAALVTTT